MMINRDAVFTAIPRLIRYHRHRPKGILFDHLPKAAGSTVISYLKKHFSCGVTFITDGRFPDESARYFQSLSQEKRFGYRLIAGHLTDQLIPFVHPDTIKMTILRHPVDRIVSHYFYAKRMKDHYLHDTIVERDLSLLEYVTSGLSGELNNWYVSHFSRLPAVEDGMDSDTLFSLALKHVTESYDILGFQESLQDAMREVRDRAGLHDAFDNRYVNYDADNSKSSVPDDAYDAIAEMNALDVRLYDELLARYA